MTPTTPAHLLAVHAALCALDAMDVSARLQARTGVPVPEEVAREAEGVRREAEGVRRGLEGVVGRVRERLRDER